MTPRIQNLRMILKDESYKVNRAMLDIPEYVEPSPNPYIQDALSFKATLEVESPYWHPGDRIGFNRRNSTVIRSQTDVKGAFRAGNVVPDYESALNRGMEDIRKEITDRLVNCDDTQIDFLEAALLTVDTAIAYADRCYAEAEKAGLTEVSASLRRVPRCKPTSLLEACVFLKFLIYTLRCARVEHVTLGRFDKYMRPFYQADLEKGLTREELLETVEEFFLSINYDTDLYPGIQKGDNGQSLVLGGCGTFDDFSHLCMEAALALNLIDPKINLRVDKSTPDELYDFGTLMTKQGMGFPQYSNDDIVIPGMVALGYDREDAEDYAVAACWEFIVPGKGTDIPNITAMNFPKVINKVIQEQLADSGSFNEFFEQVCVALHQECDALIDIANARIPVPSPYLSVFIDGCIRKGLDYSDGGGKYRNFGIHGVGIATAADSLAAIREVIFEKKEYTPKQLLAALEADFEGFSELRNRLLSCPKMGNNAPYTDELGYRLMDIFSGYLNGKPNRLGGIFRTGTGSAQFYVYRAQTVGATPDGRHAGQPFSSSYSPSLEAKVSGPLSCIQSFTGYDLKKIINGGPLTIEIHDSVFRNQEGIHKVAMLVKAFIHLGGHQLQLNGINRDVLLDAMAHPENHKNLIVRVWGWSGYFNELDMPFKEQIIKRTEFMV